VTRKKRDVGHMPVMKAQCATCPFRAGGDAGLQARIERQVLSEASQTCHHTGVIHSKPDTHLCRGARDFQLQFFYRIGFLDEATDDAWQAKLAEVRGER
jgi:hypothetical protein